MAQKTVSSSKKPIPHGLSADDCVAMYRAMVLTRAYDDRGFKLQRQGRIGFYAGSFGEEATQIGTAYAGDEADWYFTSYRQPGIALFRGLPLQTMMDNLFCNSRDVVKGRQMPVHYTGRQQHFLSVSSVIGTQIIQGVGCAMGIKIKGDRGVVFTYLGDGATSANDFHSGMNFAGVTKAPVIFVLVNNQYAISTPLSKQTAVEVLADKAKAYGFVGIQVDGNDVLAVYAAAMDAKRRAEAGEGPTLLELKTYRAGPHSSSDDPSRYRTEEQTQHWLERDPLTVLKNHMISFGIWDDTYETCFVEEANAMLGDAVKQAEAVGEPSWDTLFTDVYTYKSQTLADQEQDIMAHEQDLDLKNEGEFPL